MARLALLEHVGWLVGLIASDISVCLLLGFMANAYRFASGVFLISAAIEALLFHLTQSASTAIWVGSAISALPTAFFTQRFYFNMGD